MESAVLCICLDDDEPTDKNAKARHVWHLNTMINIVDALLKRVLTLELRILDFDSSARLVEE